MDLDVEIHCRQRCPLFWNCLRLRRVCLIRGVLLFYIKEGPSTRTCVRLLKMSCWLINCFVLKWDQCHKRKLIITWISCCQTQWVFSGLHEMKSIELAFSYVSLVHAYISCSSFDFGTVGWLGVVKVKDVFPGLINRSNNTIQALWWNFSMCKTHSLHVQQHAKHMFCAMVDLTTHTASCDSAFYGEQTICASTSEKIKLVTTWQNWCITEKCVACLPFCRPNPPATKPLSKY